jgi:hypothetical protein
VSVQVQYDRKTRQILAHGQFPGHDPADPDTGVAVVADPSPLALPGTKALADDGTIVVTPPTPPTPAEIAAAAALLQQDADDLTGFRSVYAALGADAATLEDTTQALTVQQLRNRLAALERIVARLARYAGRHLA